MRENVSFFIAYYYGYITHNSKIKIIFEDKNMMHKDNSNIRKVVIDCDPGIDDSLAIMLALSLPGIELIGITIVAGNSPVEMGFGNAKKVLSFMNRLDVPIYMGADKPLVREFINALDTHGEDGLGESFLDEVPGYRQEEEALDFYKRILATEEDISVIALGPMTNLAMLASEDEAAFARIKEIVSMGGSFKSHGNCSPVAEYNYWCDPDGAAKVYEACGRLNLPLHMVGLDVTREIVLTPKLIDWMKTENTTMGEFVEKITGFYMKFHWKQEHIVGCVINDPLAVAYFYDRDICQGFEAFTQIETMGISIGQSVVDSMDFYRKKANARILTQVDKIAFFDLFFASLLGKNKEELNYEIN